MGLLYHGADHHMQGGSIVGPCIMGLMSPKATPCDGRIL